MTKSGNNSCATTQTVSHKPLVMQVWVQTQSSQCGICGGHSGIRKGLLYKHLFSRHCHSTNATYSFILLAPSLYNLTYLLTPWSRVLLEKPIGSQLVKKFPKFYGTRRSLLHSQVPPPAPFLSQLDPVHPPHPTSRRSILILSSHLCLGLPSGITQSSLIKTHFNIFLHHPSQALNHYFPSDFLTMKR